MKYITKSTRRRGWPHLRCCTVFAHFDLLADLEQDADHDPDIAGLLPRIRYLLVGSAATPGIKPLVVEVISCPDCGREFAPGTSWPNANYCRASFLLPYIAVNPDLSAWELSQRTGMPYRATVKALQKAREWAALQWFEEPKENGEGVRFRYRVVPGQETRLQCRDK